MQNKVDGGNLPTCKTNSVHVNHKSLVVGVELTFGDVLSQGLRAESCLDLAQIYTELIYGIVHEESTQMKITQWVFK